jgi:hypothetical protein
MNEAEALFGVERLWIAEVDLVDDAVQAAISTRRCLRNTS